MEKQIENSLANLTENQLYILYNIVNNGMYSGAELEEILAIKTAIMLDIDRKRTSVSVHLTEKTTNKK